MHEDWRTTSWMLDRMASGDDEAWRQFVGRFREPIRRLAVRAGLDDGEAEDAAQQVLLACCDGLKRGAFDREKGRLSAWLFGIVRHEVRRRGMHARRRDALGLAGGQTASAWLVDPAAERDWERTWHEQVLSIAVARVRREVQPTTWAAFERVHLLGEAPDAVAAALGMTRNAVFVAKHRVLTRLRAVEADLEDVRTERDPP